jgi:hypothetical protein
MKSWDYVKPFISHNFKKCGYRLPIEMIRYIYLFILNDIHNRLSNKYISNKIHKHMRCTTSGDFTIHFNEIPYFKINNENRIKCKNAIISSINAISNKEYDFSHYCCTGKGLVISINNQSNNRQQSYIIF